MRTAGLSPFQIDHYAMKLRGFMEALIVMLVMLLLVLGLSAIGITDARAQSLPVTLTSSASTGVAPHTHTLTWTSPAGSTCAASGSWTGNKAASGTQEIRDLQSNASYRLICNRGASGGQAELSWQAPTQNTDGTPITNFAGYRIVHGQTADALTSTIQTTTPAVTRYTVTNLAAGPRFFGVKAYTSTGVESVVSNIANKTITVTPAASAEATVAVTVMPRPNPPTQLQVVENVVYNVGQFYHAKWMPLRGIRYGTIPLGEPCMVNRPVIDSYYGVDKAKVTWDPGKASLNYPIAKCSVIASTSSLSVE